MTTGRAIHTSRSNDRFACGTRGFEDERGAGQARAGRERDKRLMAILWRASETGLEEQDRPKPSAWGRGTRRGPRAR